MRNKRLNIQWECISRKSKELIAQSSTCLQTFRQPHPLCWFFCRVTAACCVSPPCADVKWVIISTLQIRTPIQSETLWLSQQPLTYKPSESLAKEAIQKSLNVFFPVAKPSPKKTKHCLLMNYKIQSDKEHLNSHSNWTEEKKKRTISGSRCPAAASTYIRSSESAAKPVKNHNSRCFTLVQP